MNWVRVADFWRRRRANWFPKRQPIIEPQVEPADCGYLCASALLAQWGIERSVHDIKEIAGRTSRGLTLRQLRDVLAACGLEADAVFFDRKEIDAFPCTGIVLQDRGHYVAVVKKRGDRLEVYDPVLGWSWMRRRRLARTANGFGIQVRGLIAGASAPRPKQRADYTNMGALPLGRTGVSALIVFALAQLAMLVLPLLSARSVDAVTGGQSIGFAGQVGLGFVFISLTTALMNFFGEIFSVQVSKRATTNLGRTIFDKLVGMPAAWFEATPATGIQNKVASIETLLTFAVDLFRSISGIAISLLVGAIALFYVSPWLAIPGLVALGLSIAIDLYFNQTQRPQLAASLDILQRRQAFNLDILSQIPLFARFGALKRARARYAVVVGQSATIDANMQRLRNWRTIAIVLLRACETLIFVSLAAAFMANGGYTLGAFVALGSYKDLLAQSMSSLFQLRQRHKNLDVHRLQATDLARGAAANYDQCRTLISAGVELKNVSFRYGSLDAYVLRQLHFIVRDGECVAINGASGTGKSTIAKLIVGVLTPTEGEVLVDGSPPRYPLDGMGAVLQGDRLITGSIRDNVTLFRGGPTDEDIERALHAAEIHEWVMSLPMRLNTMIAEGMTGLSGGQRQRLMIARAVLEKPRLLLLDEATASLDVETERRILNNLRSAGVTLVLIAHRPEVWRLADRVLTLDVDGAVREAHNVPDIAATAT